MVALLSNNSRPMNTKKKIAYVNQVMERFENARNHGKQGDNWWRPKPMDDDEIADVYKHKINTLADKLK